MIPAYHAQHISWMLSSLTDNVCKALGPSSGITLVITVGNSLRSDDGIGPFIFQRLTSAENFKIIDAGIKPENIIDEAVELKPAKIIIIDAASFGGTAGEARIISEEHLPRTSLSTHSIPLPVFTGILKEDTGAEIVFLGIQASSMDLGEGLSSEVKKTGDEIIRFIHQEYIER